MKNKIFQHTLFAIFTLVNVIIFIPEKANASTPTTADTATAILSADQLTVTVSASGDKGCSGSCTRAELYDVGINGYIQGPSINRNIGYTYYAGGTGAATWEFPSRFGGGTNTPSSINPVSISDLPNGTYRFCAQVVGSVTPIWPNDYSNVGTKCSTVFEITNRVSSVTYGSGTTNLAVYQNPDVGLNINGTSSATISAGQSANLNWTTTATNSGNSCTASGSWSGAVAGTPGTTYAYNTGTMSTPGTYTYNIQCTGALNSSTAVRSVTLTVQSAPDFSLNVSPASASIVTGQSATYNVAATCTNFTGPITSLYINNGFSQGVAMSLNSTSVACGSSVTLNVTTDGSASPTNTPTNISVAGTGTGIGTKTSNTVTLTVYQNPTLTLTANPVSVTTGQSATLTWSTANVTGNCTASGDWSGSKVTSGSESTGNLTTEKTYSYTLTCPGYNGTSVTQTATVVAAAAVTPNFSLTLSPTSQSVNTGVGAVYTIQATCVGSFVGPVTSLVVNSGYTTGAPTSLSSGTVACGGTATLTVTGSSSTNPVNTPVNLSVTGSGSGVGSRTSNVVQHTINYNPNFTITLTPASLTKNAGESLSYQASITCSGGITGGTVTNITVNTNFTAGVTPSAQSNRLCGDTWNVNISTTTFASPINTPVDVYVSGSYSGIGTRNSNVVQLTLNGVPDYTISVSPATQTIVAGQTLYFTATTVCNQAMTGDINFNGVNAAATTSWGYSAKPIPCNGSTTFYFNTSSTATPGTYTFSFSSYSINFPTITRAASAKYTILSPPTFSISLSPSQRYIMIGSSTSYTGSVTCAGGFTGPIDNLTVQNNFTAGVNFSLSATSVNCGGSFTVNITTDSNSSPLKIAKAVVVSGEGSGVGTKSNSGNGLTIYPYPTLNLTANPTNIEVGQSSTLSWTTTETNSSTCTASGDWTGSKATSGTASTGILNTVKTYSYTLVCYGYLSTPISKTATVTVGASMQPPASISASNSTCGQITVSWNPAASGANPTGYRVYRSTDGVTWGSVWQTVAYTGAASYSVNDTTPLSSSGSNYYSVTAYNASTETSRVSTTAITPVACTTSVSYKKEIIAVQHRNQTYTFNNSTLGCAAGETIALPNGQLFEEGDKVTFRVIACNTGSNSYTGTITISDTATNMKLPATGVNATPINCSGTCTSSITTASAPNGDATLNMSFSNSSGPILTAGQTVGASFTLEVKNNTGSISQYYRFSNCATFNFNPAVAGNSGGTVCTPPILFVNGSGGVGRQEVSP